jgi:hypothetical protein
VAARETSHRNGVRGGRQGHPVLHQVRTPSAGRESRRREPSRNTSTPA